MRSWSHFPMRSLLLLCVTLVLMSTGGASAATFVIINGDEAGEGFNDPTPWTPTGGNPATTLGAARLNAFQHAADLWGEILLSGVTIEVLAYMNPLTCTPTGATLGSAGTTSVHRDFPNRPASGTWYPQALANALAGTDLNPGVSDIQAVFNSNLNGDAGCLQGAEWYYGYDAKPPAQDFDFITVVMHEIGHGLGFQTFCDLATGTPFQLRNDMYMLEVEQAGANPSNYSIMGDAQRVAANISDPALRWRGPNVTYIVNHDPPISGMNGNYLRLHAPNPLQPGSSVAHWSTAVNPNEMMEPIFTTPTHDPGLAKFLMADIGWTLDASVPVAFPGIAATEKGSAVELRWEYAGGAIQGFRIYRRDGEHAPEHALRGGELLAADRRTHLDFEVEAGREYEYAVAAVGLDGSELRSPTVKAEIAVRRTSLAQNHPNPFNPRTEISYRLARSGPVRLTVYDLRGRELRVLVDEVQEPGEYTVTWDGRDAKDHVAAAGTYFYRLDSEDAPLVRRMVLLK